MLLQIKELWFCICDAFHLFGGHLFWHALLMIVDIGFGYKLGHSSTKTTLQAEYFEFQLTSQCRPFLNICFFVFSITFNRTFGALGSILAPF